MNELTLIPSGWTRISSLAETRDVKDPIDGSVSQENTGNMRWVISDGKGNYRVMVVRPPETGKGGDYQVVDPPKDLPAPTAGEDPALQAQRSASAANTQEGTTQLQAERAQRERNQQNGLGYLSDAEVARLQSDAASQGLSQQQIDQRRAEFDRTAQQRDREIDVSQANSAIAAANSRLAEQRQNIEARVAEGNLSLDQAKLEYQKAKDAVDADIEQQKIKISSAQQAATAENQRGTLAVQQGQLGVQQGQAAETQRSNLANEGLRSSAEQRAAAGDVLTAQQNAAQTGAGLLNQRVSALTGLYNNTLSQVTSSKNLGLGSTPDLSNLPNAISDWGTQLGGGAGVYDVAAKAVQNLAPGGASNPMAAQAYAVLSQIMDAGGGQAHPVVQAAANMQPSQPQTFSSPSAQASPAAAAAAPSFVFNFASPSMASAPPTIQTPTGTAAPNELRIFGQ